MKVVFDFGGVLFRWHPPSFLARVWPHRVADEQVGAEVAKTFFQAYGGDWGAFDQGLTDAATTADRITARTGWPREEIVAVMEAVPQELQLIEGTAAEGYRSVLLHRAADRSAGEQGELRDAYGGRLTIAPKAG